MFEFITKSDEIDKYRKVARRLRVHICFVVDARCNEKRRIARVTGCSIKDFTRELQRVIQEEKMPYPRVERKPYRSTWHDNRKLVEYVGKTHLMTPEDVKKRLDAGEDPLMVSIDHWMENVRWLKEGKTLPGSSLSEGTCALCTAHRYHDFRKSACSKCVLYQATGLACPDSGSPWITFYDNRTLSNAIAMLDALLSCLEYTPEPEKQFYIWQEGKEPEGKVGLYLRQEGNDVCLMATDGTRKQYLISFYPDGRVIRVRSITSRLGFNLDSEGRLDIN